MRGVGNQETMMVGDINMGSVSAVAIRDGHCNCIKCTYSYHTDRSQSHSISGT